MHELVYPRERTLGKITLILGLLVWLALVVGTFGGALLALALGFVLYLFAQSALIAYIRGNGVELTEAQFPDLYAQFSECCERLQIQKRPQAYILNGSGGLNAFATSFLGTQYVVLYSDVVDAMDQHADGVRFYIGHELGHLRMKHLRYHFLRWPVLWLPLLGAAYSRARESTCDRHGRVCCSSPEDAARALTVLAAGVERWKQLDMAAYLRQTEYTRGFWMSFHELTSGYPWLTKRAARVMQPDAAGTSRNFFAYVLAAFVPFAGRLGAGFGMLILVYIIGTLAAIGLPAYQDYTARAKLAAAFVNSQDARDTLGRYYEEKELVPESLSEAGVPVELTDGMSLAYDAEEMALTVVTSRGNLIFTPTLEDDDGITWVCTGGIGVKQAQLPPSCRDDERDRDEYQNDSE